MNGKTEDTPLETQPAPETLVASQHGNAGDHWHVQAGGVFKYGIFIGLLLIATSLAARRYDLATPNQISILLSSGIGIILGAFGSLGTVRLVFKSVTLVGVAALTIVLYYVIQDRPLLKVVLVGDLSEHKVTFFGDTQYHGAYDKNAGHWEFIIFSTKIDAPFLKMWVEKGKPEPAELPFECIRSSIIKPYLAGGGTLHWRFISDEEPRIIDDSSSEVIASLRCAVHSPTVAAAPPPTSLFGSVSLISGAHAQVASESGHGHIRRLLEELESNNPQTRYHARQSLAAAGDASAPALLRMIESESSSYRSVLGSLMAISGMSRLGIIKQDTLRGEITDDAVDRLRDLAVGKDPTIRYYASEVMMAAIDLRVIRTSMEKLPEASANGRYNLLLIVREGARRGLQLTEDELAEVGRMSLSGGAKTSQLAKEILAIAALGEAKDDRIYPAEGK